MTRPGGRGERPTFAPGSFLDGLSPAVRDELLGQGVLRQYESGHRLLREGGTDTHMFLLLRGFVKITAVVDGVETLLAIRVPGDSLGEIAAISGKPRIATVTACGRVLAVMRSQADFRAFLRRNPDAAAMMTAAMGERLHWANLRRADFSAYPAEVRLARVLLAIAQSCGRPTEAGLLIDVRLTQAELASMIGAAEATAQKAIRDLRDRGLIDTGYRRITIVDAERMRALDDDDIDR